MSCVKGSKKTGGRVAGTPNKTTKATRELIADIVEHNAAAVQKKLDLVADPKDWLTLYIRLLEFNVPKRAAVTVAAEGNISDLKSELEKLENKEV